MNRLREIRLIPATLALYYALTLCPAPVLMAAEPPTPATDMVVSTDSTLVRARELIKEGDYDRAIELLKGTIAESRGDPARLSEAYLLLVKTYVTLGNYLKFQPQGREASNLNYKAARDVIAECLRTKELRHARPEPASEYPPEMISAFAEVRGQVFGSFRVLKTEPPNAVVLLGGDTLRALPPENLLGDVDLAVGPYLVVVHAAGYKDVVEQISISPNSTLERSYLLPKRRSRTWYATVATGTLGVVGGLVALIAGGKEKASSTGPEPLAGPPPPPAQ